MDIGSKEHKQILLNSIVKIAVKTATIGFVIGVFLMLPSLLRENTFSTGLAYAGQAIVIFSLVYAIAIAIKKYRQTLGALNNLDSLNESNSTTQTKD